MELDAIVFDFDGVIADTEPLHLLAFQEQLATVGLSLNQQDYLDRYLGCTDREGFAAVALDQGRRLAPDIIDRLIAQKTVRVQARIGTMSLMFPGVADRVREWAPQVPMAIASGALRVEIEALLASGNLAPCFRTIVSADDPVASKPSPEPYQLALTRLTAANGDAVRPERCVAIEDSVWGMTSARAAGMRVVGVTTSYAAGALGDADLVVPGVAELTLEMLEDIVSLARR